MRGLLVKVVMAMAMVSFVVMATAALVFVLPLTIMVIQAAYMADFVRKETEIGEDVYITASIVTGLALTGLWWWIMSVLL